MLDPVSVLLFNAGMKFTATLELHGKTATGIEVPEDVVTGLGAGKRPPVRVTINGHTYRSTIAAYNGGEGTVSGAVPSLGVTMNCGVGSTFVGS